MSTTKPLSVIPTARKSSHRKGKNTMLSVPEKLRAAAMELLERVRVGLDIPSRSEVMALADRIEAISTKLDQLETKRAEDHRLVETLRGEADKAKGAAKKGSKKSATTSKAKSPSSAKSKTSTPRSSKAKSSKAKSSKAKGSKTKGSKTTTSNRSKVAAGAKKTKGE